MVFAEKVKKLVKSRAFLFKLLLTILVFVFIPLLGMQIFLINHSTKEFQKTNEKYYFSVPLRFVKTKSAYSFALPI